MIRTETFRLGDIPHFVFPLWREAFGDSEDTVRRLLSAASEIYAGFIGDEAAGIACAFDVSAQGRRGKYLYAVCTAEKFRGRGIMRAVIGHACAEMERGGYSFAFLIPAKAEYLAMYAKLGFADAFPGMISVDGGRVMLDEDAAAPYMIPYDGDSDRLYDLYVRSDQTVIVKDKRLFDLSIEGFDIAYLSREGEKMPCGYVVFERIGKKSLNILEIRGCTDVVCGIIYADCRLRRQKPSASRRPLGLPVKYATDQKALFRFFDGTSLPKDTPVDLFLEL